VPPVPTCLASSAWAQSGCLLVRPAHAKWGRGPSSLYHYKPGTLTSRCITPFWVLQEAKEAAEREAKNRDDSKPLDVSMSADALRELRKIEDNASVNSLKKLLDAIQDSTKKDSVRASHLAACGTSNGLPAWFCGMSGALDLTRTSSSYGRGTASEACKVIRSDEWLAD
jgi:hypothetical protein